MMKTATGLSVFFLILCGVACRNTALQAAKRVDKHFIDSLIMRSDSSFSKNYKRNDFVTATHYISRKDSTELQLMQDSAKEIRQLIMTRNAVRIYFAQYYANGQLMADLKLDSFGQYHGPAVYYFENGNIQSEGKYRNGLSSGQWVENDGHGNRSIINYDSNGARTNK